MSPSLRKFSGCLPFSCLARSDKPGHPIEADAQNSRTVVAPTQPSMAGLVNEINRFDSSSWSAADQRVIEGEIANLKKNAGLRHYFD